MDAMRESVDAIASCKLGFGVLLDDEPNMRFIVLGPT